MYNRYFDPEHCAPVEPQRPEAAGSSLLSSLLGSGAGGAAGLLSGLTGEAEPDGGDLLLPLLCYALYRESGDEEWLILLVLLLLTGL